MKKNRHREKEKMKGFLQGTLVPGKLQVLQSGLSAGKKGKKKSNQTGIRCVLGTNGIKKN